MATARDRHYHTRSARLVTGLVVAAALPQPCNNMTLTRLFASYCLDKKSWEGVHNLFKKTSVCYTVLMRAITTSSCPRVVFSITRQYGLIHNSICVLATTSQLLSLSFSSSLMIRYYYLNSTQGDMVLG